MLALLAAAENVLPPLPADTAVALGAFLSHRGLTTPLGVFLVVWTSNSLGACGIYYVARRFGRRLFSTPTGQRLLAPEAVAVIEREYLRFGLIGIFLSRFLPGIRAVVPPFAGLVNLSPLRALVPIVIASGIWYGGVTWLGATIGAEWGRIATLLGQVNRTLAVVGGVLIVGGAVWWFVRRRRARRRWIWDVLWGAFGPAAEEADPTTGDTQALRSAALLVLELAYVDDALSPEDRRAVEADLRARWQLPQSRRAGGRYHADEVGRFTRYARRIRDRVAAPERLAVVERMWAVALASPSIGEHEERLMGLAGDLLGFTPDELAEARRRAQAEGERLP